MHTLPWMVWKCSMTRYSAAIIGVLDPGIRCLPNGDGQFDAVRKTLRRFLMDVLGDPLGCCGDSKDLVQEGVVQTAFLRIFRRPLQLPEVANHIRCRQIFRWIERVGLGRHPNPVGVSMQTGAFAIISFDQMGGIETEFGVEVQVGIKKCLPEP